MTYLGNISLLDQEKHGFLCSRTTRSSVILPCLDWAVEHARGTEPVISTFHSEMESAVLDMLLQGTCPIILVLARRLYKNVPERLQPALGVGRLLIVSTSNLPRISRASAAAANEFVCQQATTLPFGFLSTTSSLFSLYEMARDEGKQVNAIINN